MLLGYFYVNSPEAFSSSFVGRIFQKYSNSIFYLLEISNQSEVKILHIPLESRLKANVFICLCLVLPGFLAL